MTATALSGAASPGSPMIWSGVGSPTQGARLRSEVSLAASVVAPHWPISSFIAVNPLGGLEDRPFDEAARRAGEVFGARATFSEEQFRTLHAEGRITDVDLVAALRSHDHGADRSGELDFGSARLSEIALLRLDLLHGEVAQAPTRTVLTRAEQRSDEVTEAVDATLSKWCAGYFGAPGAAWSMPDRHLGFYGAWRALAPHDRAFSRSTRRSLASLPERADDAAVIALLALGVEETAWREYAVAHLSRQPGWAGHVRWRATRDGSRDDLFDLVTIRLVVEAELLGAAGVFGARDPVAPTTVASASAAGAVPGAMARVDRIADAIGAEPTLPQRAEAAAVLEGLPAAQRPFVWLAAYEHHYRDDLLRVIAAKSRRSGKPLDPSAARPAARPAGRPQRPTAQVVCCIDTRSEGLRRHLEADVAIETLGFAGFFAAAIRYRDLAGGGADDLCPALISPRNVVDEVPTPGGDAEAARNISGRRVLDGATGAMHRAERGGLAPFALAESAGWLIGPAAAARTFSAGRYGRLRERLQRAVAPSPSTTVDVERGFTAEERIQLAEVALKTMGLTRDFARLVVLCGHGSSTENNPYGAALDCGACGGNRGGANARTAVAILNRIDVREGLAERGIVVASDTWFVAAEHDTTTDAVEILDRHLVPDGHREDLDALGTTLDTAAAALAVERAGTLPGAPRATPAAAAQRHARTRAADWAQVYPEWGLARNAAMVVGPRAMTRDLDLQRRVFLHSYDPAVDEQGDALETILTAPLVVAQWINCQYLFSSVDPAVFGAGTKTIHNAIAGVGVLAGQAGDLQTGLPWQSVAEGDRLVHEPMRLLAVVQAPTDRIETIVARNTGLRHLIDHDWIALVARPGEDAPWQRRTRAGWNPWNTTQEDLGA